MSIIGLRAVGPFDTTHPWIGSMFSAAVEPDNIDSAMGEKEQADGTQDAVSYTHLTLPTKA